MKKKTFKTKRPAYYNCEFCGAPGEYVEMNMFNGFCNVCGHCTNNP